MIEPKWISCVSDNMLIKPVILCTLSAIISSFFTGSHASSLTESSFYNIVGRINLIVNFHTPGWVLNISDVKKISCAPMVLFTPDRTLLGSLIGTWHFSFAMSNFRLCENLIHPDIPLNMQFLVLSVNLCFFFSSFIHWFLNSYHLLWPMDTLLPGHSGCPRCMGWSLSWWYAW